jgi:SNF2 family DNA or RNA helicase
MIQTYDLPQPTPDDSYEVKLRFQNFRIPVKVKVDGPKLRLNFNYYPDHMHIILPEIKQLAGARWDPKLRHWSCENSSRNLFRLQFMAEKEPYAPYMKALVDLKPRRGEIVMSHQIEQMAFTYTRHQCICALEMGAGKTLAMMEAMEAAGFDDWWWVAPKSALYSVKLEFERWKICDICNLPRQRIEFNGKVLEAHKPDHIFTSGKCVTPKYFTYENLRKVIDEWPEGKKPPRGVIFDECSRCKNPTAQRSQSALILANKIRTEYGREGWIVLMSGSPAPKSPLDWWMQAEIACPGYLREGDIHKFKNRLAVVEQRESITGGVYPHLVCFRDSVDRCEQCGKLKDSPLHDLAAGGHTFKSCGDEVSMLNKRMAGLVMVKFKKDCLDLPEKIYRLIELKPSAEMLRAAALINARSPTAIQALTLLRELSDGFQYKETECGEQTCSICKGSQTMDEVYDALHPDQPLDGLSIEYGRRVLYDEVGTPEITDEPIQIATRKIACPSCSGTGSMVKLSRESIEIKSPKEELLVDLLDEHEEAGRFVVYGGFTGSIDKIVKVVKRQGWEHIRVDGRGWESSLRGYHPVRMLDGFQNDKKIDKLCFIGQPSSAGMGLNLTASPSTFYYSNDFNAESRIQSEDRIHRPGMDTNRGATIIDAVLLPSDLLVLNNLKRKKRLQDLSLGQMREEIEALKFSTIRYM